MPTIYVKEVVEQVSVLLDDIRPAQFIKWTERELIGWLNDASRALSMWIPSSVTRDDAIKLTLSSLQSIADIPATRIKPGDGSAPIRVQSVQFYCPVCNMGATGDTPGASIPIVDSKTMDGSDPSWRSKEGPEIECVVVDSRTPKQFEVYPRPNSDTWIRIKHAAIPNKIEIASANQFAKDSVDTTLIPFGDECVGMAVNYILARAYLSKSGIADGVSLASSYSQMFIAAVNAQVTAQTGNNPNLKMLPFAPVPSGRAN